MTCGSTASDDAVATIGTSSRGNRELEQVDADAITAEHAEHEHRDRDVFNATSDGSCFSEPTPYLPTVGDGAEHADR